MAEDHSQPPDLKSHGVRTATVVLILTALVILFYRGRSRRLGAPDRPSTAPADRLDVIERLGGTIDRSDPTRVEVALPTATDANLEHVIRLESVTSLDLARSSVTDEGLKQIRRMPVLETLTLENTKVTDSGLKHLRPLTQLGQLDLTGTQVTGSGLGALQDLANLRIVFLSDTRIDDEGLAYLAGLTQLELLFLNRQRNEGGERASRVTDQGLKHLRQLENLVLLDVRNTGVTAAGVATTKAALPRCNIRFGPEVSAAGDFPSTISP